MSLIKTKEEIQKMREGGAILSKALEAAIEVARPGVAMRKLDEAATRTLEDAGARPSFRGYKGGGEKVFPSTVCISINNEVVHGSGIRDIELKEGDIVGLDIGCWYKGLCTDMAATIPIGNISKERLELLRVTREAMYTGVSKAMEGNLISDIGNTIEESLDTKKYGIVKSLVGHGVGHAVHEDPHIPNYKTDKFPRVEIKKGMCLAIEPMITAGGFEVKTLNDGWTIATIDGSDAAHFEVTVVVTDGEPEIITPQPVIKGLGF